MKFNDINPAVDLENDEVLVRLFGALEMANREGSLCENKTKPSALTWITLKYLLVNSNRDVEQDELLSLEFPGKTVTVPDGAMRTRLRRVRDLLLPLKLGSMRGLVLYSDGKYSINSDYTLLTDEDAFNILLKRIRSLPAESVEGLELCFEALELCRGTYLGYSGEAKWLEPYREHYRREFCALAEDTLGRMRALGDDGAASLLWRRAIVIAPEDEELHKAIIGYLVERRQELELLRYVTQLSHKGAKWLEAFEY